ncbi:adenosine deaminase [Lacrimispora sp.]|uniref:adenosine deaminase n=1 Tax=Lacrimispora sp. TaxID=2719234 RepID=UPI00285978D5|nr:adenosine deaminase [Lacrimispora sp.]MDR7813531.1 adenosine deaminase [Lacrimispora sp.]
MKRLETDLHLHLDGSLSIETVKLLAAQVGYDFEGRGGRKSLVAGENCESLVDYLKCFDLPGMLLQTEEALELASHHLTKELASQGLILSEIRFAPQLHTGKGLTKEKALEAVIRGVRKGTEKSHMHAGILLCAMVNGTDRENEETFELAKAYLGKGVVGVDLAGPEGMIPMEHFEPLFKEAGRRDIPFTIHAGECGDYENITKAVYYGAKRIGHGCAAIKSEACMDLLKKEKIILEMCVISNLQTRAVPSIEEHPLKAFYDRGIRVTYNTDNMTVSDTTLEKEAELIKKYMGFTEADLRQMNRYALEGAFLENRQKEKIFAFFDNNNYNEC